MGLSELPLHWVGPVLVPVAAVAVGWYGIYEPQRARLQRVEKSYQDEQRKMTQRRTIADSERLIDAYQQRLAKTADTDWLIAQTALVATNVKTQLTSVSPQRPTTETGGYTRLSIVVECELTYHELGLFVAALESAQPFIQVDQIDVGAAVRTDAQHGTPGANRRNITLTLSTMYMAASS